MHDYEYWEIEFSVSLNVAPGPYLSFAVDALIRANFGVAAAFFAWFSVLALQRWWRECLGEEGRRLI